MKKAVKPILATLLTGMCIQQATALEVDREVMPRMTLGGRVIATMDNYNYDSAPTKEDEINLEDSTLLMRFDKRMFADGVAGAVLGLKDHNGSAEFNQMHAFYWNQNFETILGRTRLRNTLIEFPLIRDDDFLGYTHVGNASSDSEGAQTHGNLFSVDWIIDQKVQKFGAWAGTRENDSTVYPNAPDGFDSYGASYIYSQPETLIYLKPVRRAGIMLDSQKVSTASGNQWMDALIAGAEFNLNDNPQSNWSMALQAIANDGISGITTSQVAHTTGSVSARARAKSNSIVAGLRYTSRPHLLTRWQAGLSLAYKDYSDLDNASQWSIAPNFSYRIGQGVDLLAQTKYTEYDTALGGGRDVAIQVGISFSLESTFNNNIGERDSILNLEHGYIK